MLPEDKIRKAYERFRESLLRHRKTVPKDLKEKLEQMISEKSYEWFKSGIKDFSENGLDSYTNKCEANNYIELYAGYQGKLSEKEDMDYLWEFAEMFENWPIIITISKYEDGDN